MPEPTEEVLSHATYILSEWLNDGAPIGERRYREPARALLKFASLYHDVPAPDAPKTSGGAVAWRSANEHELDFLEWAYETLYEINPSNYDHDEVCHLNSASVEVILAIKSRAEILRAAHPAPDATKASGEAVAWCQPMDEGKPRPRMFIVRFEDKDVGDAVFDNEAEARDYWERANTNWNCFLFGAMPLRRCLRPCSKGWIGDWFAVRGHGVRSLPDECGIVNRTCVEGGEVGAYVHEIGHEHCRSPRRDRASES